jgi:hypothetical protein
VVPRPGPPAEQIELGGDRIIVPPTRHASHSAIASASVHRFVRPLDGLMTRTSV